MLAQAIRDNTHGSAALDCHDGALPGSRRRTVILIRPFENNRLEMELEDGAFAGNTAGTIFWFGSRPLFIPVLADFRIIEMSSLFGGCWFILPGRNLR